MIDNAKMGNFEYYPELIRKSIEHYCQQFTHLGYFVDAEVIVEGFQKMRDADQISKPACTLIAKT